MGVVVETCIKYPGVQLELGGADIIWRLIFATKT